MKPLPNKSSPGKPSSGKSHGMRGNSERAGHVQAWACNHADAARRSFGRRLQAPGHTLIMLTVLGFILALPAYLWLLLDHAQHLAGGIDHEPRIALYLDDLTADEQAAVADRIGALPNVAALTHIGADQALENYRAALPDPGLLDWLDSNPLPAIIEVLPLTWTPEAVHALERVLATVAPQATIVSDHEWIRQLQALHGAGLRILLVITGLLALGVALILMAASASELRERREEIAISRITGATDRFLRRPSLYGGLVIGLGGGVFAYLLLWIGVLLARGPVEAAAAAFGLPMPMPGPAAPLALALIAGGLILGWIGARLGSTIALRD